MSIESRTTATDRALASVMSMELPSKNVRIRDLRGGQTIVFDDGPACEVVEVQPIGGDLFIVDWREPDGSVSSTAPVAGGRPITVKG